MRRILDTKYEKADLNMVMAEQCQHINTAERYRLLTLLRKYEALFNVTFGTWNTAPADVELNDDAKPVCLIPYPVSRVQKAMSRKEVERLLSSGVIKEANNYKWGAPSFSQPKTKINHVRFLSDFRNLNRQLKRKPYPMQKARGIL